MSCEPKEETVEDAEECPVCLEATATHCVVGCDHAFCQRCVARWCTSRSAYCPLCRQEVFGILCDAPGRVYLSPHHGAWRVRLREVACGLEIVEADDLSRAHGLEEGMVIYINGSDVLEHACAAIRAAFRDKRLLQVDVRDERVSHARYCGSCCCVG